jgi:DNA-binding XRE family transcriptional regulator
MKLDGSKVKQLRESKGWNQTQLGSKCKPRLTTQTICSAENWGEIYPGTASRIALALSVAVEDLLPLEGDDHAARKNNSRSRSTKRSLPKSARVA